jgi:hypothetical protein
MHTISYAIAAIAYDEHNHLLLTRYRDSGETVVYEGVPQELYDSLIFAESIGGFVRSHIEGRFPVRRN